MKKDALHQLKDLGKQEVFKELMYFIREYDEEFYKSWIIEEYQDLTTG